MCVRPCPIRHSFRTSILEHPGSAERPVPRVMPGVDKKSFQFLVVRKYQRELYGDESYEDFVFPDIDLPVRC